MGRVWQTKVAEGMTNMMPCVSHNTYGPLVQTVSGAETWGAIEDESPTHLGQHYRIHVYFWEERIIQQAKNQALFCSII
jgi:hypothetical protein